MPEIIGVIIFDKDHNKNLCENNKWIVFKSLHTAYIHAVDDVSGIVERFEELNELALGARVTHLPYAAVPVTRSADGKTERTGSAIMLT